LSLRPSLEAAGVAKIARDDQRASLERVPVEVLSPEMQIAQVMAARRVFPASREIATGPGLWPCRL